MTGREGDPSQDSQIVRILQQTSTIAVVGLSPRPERDSHRVARYLLEHGFRVIPVHPGVDQVLGLRAYPSLDAVPESVDLVDVFRRPEHIPELADAALARGDRGFWMQLEIRSPEAARRLRAAGLPVVEDRCLAVEHARRRR